MLLLNLLVVVGPKDIGKSAGIVKMKPHWYKARYVTIDINLKGETSPVDGHTAMKNISSRFLYIYTIVVFTSTRNN